MDEDEFEGDFADFGTNPAPSRRFQSVDVLVLLFDLLRGIAHALYNTADSAFQLTAAHANWRVDRDAFHEEAALELETLTGDDDG
jgi:hypothetical protein